MDGRRSLGDSAAGSADRERRAAARLTVASPPAAVEELPAWEEMDDDMRKPWYEAADKKREREARIKIAIDRLEPEIIDASEPSIQMSIAISLKRIADSLEER